MSAEPELNQLIGSIISLISAKDVCYRGQLFSINPEKSEIILKNVECLGTEGRVSNPAHMVPRSPDKLDYVR